MMKTVWKTAYTAVCLCVLLFSMTGCVQSSDSGGGSGGTVVPPPAHAPECRLQSLRIDRYPSLAFLPDTYIYEDLEILTGPIKITAVPEKPAARVFIDGKDSTAADYGTVQINADCSVEVKVENGDKSDVYTVEFKALHAATVNISVTDSIGGTVVNGTKLKVYKSGSSEQIGSDYTVTNGIAEVSDLVQGRCYDFELIGEKGKWAGSRLENYKLINEAVQTVQMIQSEHAMLTRGITPPKITSAKAGASSASKPITENSVIEGFDEVAIVFESDVGAVEGTASGAFGAKLGIGKAPNQMSGISGSCEVSKSGTVFTSTCTFDLGEVPDGKDTLIVVGYDIAHNRIEKHIPVTFKKYYSFSSSDLSGCKFKELFMIAERLPYSESIYALDPVEGRRSSYRMLARFEFKNSYLDENILGFDLYRKEKGPVQEFRFVSRTLYNGLKTESQSDLGFHVGIDADSLLEQNKEYEYKIRAFNAAKEKYSPVITTKVLESFTYDLTAPVKNTVVPFANAANLSYKCKISNTNMFSSAQSDYMRLGLLINDLQGIPRFGAKLLYVFDDSGHPDIVIEVCDETTGELVERKKVSELITDGTLSAYGVHSLADLVKVDTTTGVVEFTEKFVRVPFFNVISIDGTHGFNKPLVYEKGTSYQWDIQDWGSNFASLNDDTALCFVKEYTYTDENGDQQICPAVSYGNNGANGANAVNGRFTFTVGN